MSVLGNILQGVAKGGLRSMRGRRLNREKREEGQRRMQQKRQNLDLQEEYNIKRENRLRTGRRKEEDYKYNKSLQREKEYQQKKLKEIQKLYPERWQDPQFKKQVVSAVKGVKVPRLPANKKIADLAMKGDLQNAMKLAYQSDNPEDQNFFKSVLSAMKSRQNLDRLMNPGKYKEPSREFVQGALDQGQQAIAPMLSGASQLTAGALAPISSAMSSPSNVLSPQRQQDQNLSMNELKRIKDEALRVVESFREDPKYKNDIGEFDEKLLDRKARNKYEKALKLYNTAAVRSVDYGSEKLGLNRNRQQAKAKIMDALDNIARDLRAKR